MNSSEKVLSFNESKSNILCNVNISKQKNSLDNIIETGKSKFKLNRYILLIISILICFTIGLLHGGFSDWQLIIYKTGAFNEYCTDEFNKTYVLSNLTYKACAESNVAINNLSTISFLVQFGLSPLNGFLLDTFGNKICFIYGQIVIVLAFMLLTFYSSVALAWQFFFFLIGLSSDAAYIPLLSTSRKFTDKESLIFGLHGSARSANFAIPMILRLFYIDIFNLETNEFYKVSLGFIGIILLNIILGIIILPSKKKIKDVSKKNNVSNDSKHFGDIELDAEEEIVEKNKKKKGLKSMIHMYKGKIKNLWYHPQKIEYLIILFIASMNVLNFNFYVKSNRSFFYNDDYDLTSVFAIFSILSFVPAPFFGYLANKYGSLNIIFINNLTLLISYLLLFISNKIAKIIAIVFYSLFASFCLCSIHCFINERYPKKNFGVLTGFIFLCCTVCLTINFFLTYLIEVVFLYKGNQNYFPVVIGLCIVICGILGSLIYLNRKSSYTKK